jgi:bidirectional [NiFe] hydrogenase diaphorase subunit
MLGTPRPQHRVEPASKADPAQDKRYKILDAAIRKQQARPDSLIGVLHKAQELFGFLDAPVLRHIARALRVPPSRVQGVVTFYHLFHLKPRGEHTCVVCLGTACFVKGGQKLVQAVEEQAHIRAGETTPNGKMSLVVARCIGACGIAPAVVLDQQTLGHVSAERLTTQVQEWLHGS